MCYTTDKAHMPEDHRAMANWTPERFLTYREAFPVTNGTTCFRTGSSVTHLLIQLSCKNSKKLSQKVFLA